MKRKQLSIGLGSSTYESSPPHARVVEYSQGVGDPDANSSVARTVEPRLSYADYGLRMSAMRQSTPNRPAEIK